MMKSPKSLKKSEHLPWITQEAIQFLDFFIKRASRVLEFGSGDSTIWIAKRTDHLISVEHDERYYHSVKEKLECENCKDVQLQLLERPYFSICETFPEEHFDLILIDGHNRSKCLLRSLRILKAGGVLMLDDAQRRSYQRAMKKIQHLKHFISKSVDDVSETHWWIK